MPTEPRRLGYIRISTPGQDIARQLDGLSGHCDQIHIECISGARKKRPIFDAVIAALRPGDTLVVWDFDRAFRSSADAILTGDALRARGVHFRVLGLNLDTETEEGELFYTILAAFAQYERRLLSRRTREGMEAARRAGKRIGRPPKLTPEATRDALEWIAETGHPTPYVASLLNISRHTLQRAARRKASTKRKKGTTQPCTPKPQTC